MKATSTYWAIALFFGSAIVFEAVHQLTKHASSGVKIAAQFATLALILAAVVLYVRRSTRE